MRYDAIFQWNMNQLEAEAFKIAIFYEEEFMKLFAGTKEVDGQGIRRNTIIKKGDPRKSDLFRQCWRLRRETRGLLTDSQYLAYIKANLMILKSHKSHISPNCICGDKAWIRWKVWERWYNRKESEKNCVAPPPSVSTTDPKIIREIDRTKKFLFEKCEGSPTLEKISTFIENGFFKLWLASGKVSIYYAIMSPYVQKHIEELSKICSFDVSLYKEKITLEVKDYFNHEFMHEFEQNRVFSN